MLDRLPDSQPARLACRACLLGTGIIKGAWVFVQVKLIQMQLSDYLPSQAGEETRQRFLFLASRYVLWVA